MRAALVIAGLLAAVCAGVVVLFTVGDIAGIAVLVVLLAAAVYGAWFASSGLRRVLLLVALAVFVGSVGFGGWTAARLATGLRNTSGPADRADPAALATANGKIDGVRDTAAFRLELTEQELTAVVQDGLRDANAPVRKITLDFVAGTGAEPGELRFRADFKDGSLSATGALGYRLVGGDVRLEVREISIGAVTIPRAARGAIENIAEQVGDLNRTLREQRVTVQALTMASDRMVLIGTQGEGRVITSQALLAGFKSRASALGAAQAAPPEKLGPGVVNDRNAPGAPLYVALGDSLAANVGVAQARDGYVSRFHNQVQKRDGKQYGLRNFGIAGETSGTMLRGQLDQATAAMKAADVAYVTIDVGANDVLAHLGSDDCAQGADTPACKARIEASLATYRANMETILARVKEAAPKARTIFLQTYNPFGFGFQGVRFEDDTNRVTGDLNRAAADVAQRRGVLVADGFTPLRGRAGTTTHMADASLDIHPLAIGYDALAAALLEAR